MSTKTAEHISEMADSYIPAKWMGSDFRYCTCCGESEDWLIFDEGDDIVTCNRCYWERRK